MTTFDQDISVGEIIIVTRAETLVRLRYWTLYILHTDSTLPDDLVALSRLA